MKPERGSKEWVFCFFFFFFGFLFVSFYFTHSQEEQPCGTEPSTHGIGHDLQVDNVRVKLNHRPLSWCLESWREELAVGVGKIPHMWCQKCESVGS